MKKTYLIIMLAAFVSTAATAQKTFFGGITTSDVKMDTENGKVNLKMTIDVAEDAITKLQGMAIVPFLGNGVSEADFPYVLVNGKNRNHIFERHTKFRYTSLENNAPLAVIKIDRKHRGGHIDYDATIDRQSWMNGADLNLMYILVSPAGERQYYTTALNGATVSEPVVVVVEPEPVVEPAKTIRTVSGSAYLDFQTGSSVLLPDYKRNPQELAAIKKAMDKVIADRDVKNVSMVITGNASPEGRFTSNDDLALNRAIALEKYLRNGYGKIVNDSKVLSAAEDWSGLRDMVAGSDMANKREILAIIDGADAPDVKESKLRKMAGGTSWRILLDQFFPQLRRVDYKIMYDVVD